jgi:hypothetical protein
MERGRSSGVEHNLAKVGVEGSNPFARSSFPLGNQSVMRRLPRGGLSLFRSGVHMVSTVAESDTSLLSLAETFRQSS